MFTEFLSVFLDVLLVMYSGIFQVCFLYLLFFQMYFMCFQMFPGVLNCASTSVYCASRFPGMFPDVFYCVSTCVFTYPGACLMFFGLKVFTVFPGVFPDGLFTVFPDVFKVFSGACVGGYADVFFTVFQSVFSPVSSCVSRCVSRFFFFFYCVSRCLLYLQVFPDVLVFYCISSCFLVF